MNKGREEAIQMKITLATKEMQNKITRYYHISIYG